MVMIERMYSKHEAGLYAGAYRWYDALMMFVWLIMPIFFSKFSKLKGEGKGASNLFNNGFLIVSIPMLMITPFLFFDGELLFFLFSNSSALELFQMNNLFRVLMIPFIFNAFFVLMGTYLNASGHVKKVNWVITFAILINIILNFIFIPNYGAFAAGVTTAVSTGILGLGYFVLVMFSKLRVDLKGLIGVFVGFLFCFGFYYYSKENIGDIWVSVLGSITGYFLILNLFGVVSKIKNG